MLSVAMASGEGSLGRTSSRTFSKVFRAEVARQPQFRTPSQTKSLKSLARPRGIEPLFSP